MTAETKVVALLDRCTCIVAIFTRYSPDTANERALFRRMGFGDAPGGYLHCYWPSAHFASYDSCKCPDQLTVGNGWRYVAEHWEEIGTGSVLDVEYLRGETDEPKTWEDEFGCAFPF